MLASSHSELIPKQLGLYAYPLRMSRMQCVALTHVWYSFLVNRKELTKYFAKFGKQGGKARAKKLTAEQRRASAKKAAKARWAKQKGRDAET